MDSKKVGLNTFLEEIDLLNRFRRALRHSDQLVFDDLLNKACSHVETVKSSDSLLVELLLLVLLLEEHKEIQQLISLVNDLDKEDDK